VADAIEELVDELLVIVRESTQPPIPVERIASALGVNAIIGASLFEDGRLERRGGQTVIYVRSDSPASRRRFTIAHELGHLLLAEPAGPLVAQRLLRGGAERFCDRFAASLLLPAAWVRSRYGDGPQTLRLVRSLANQAEVSLSAALIRLHELAGWTRSLLRWQRDGDAWRYIEDVALPWALRGQVRSAPQTSLRLNEFLLTTESTVLLPVTVKGRTVDVPAQLAVAGTGALALVDFSSLVKREAAQ
jgi:Zn-dependent peptidase ImmA (M78 family)